jgi:hypothetical protein
MGTVRGRNYVLGFEQLADRAHERSELVVPKTSLTSSARTKLPGRSLASRQHSSTRDALSSESRAGLA